MSIKRSDIDVILDSINYLLKNQYLTNIEKIAVCKGLQGYSIEVVKNGEQIDSFYKNLKKNQVYIFLKTLEALIYKNVTITGITDIEDQKIHNTNLIINLIGLWNSANVI